MRRKDVFPDCRGRANPDDLVLCEIIFYGHPACGGDAAHKSEDSVFFHKFFHHRLGLCRIILIIPDEVLDLPSVNSACIIAHLEKNITPAGDGTPGRCRACLGTPLGYPDFLVIKTRCSSKGDRR